MNNDNITPIAAARKPGDAIAAEIEAQRERIFRAMNLVGTTALACHEDNDMDRRGTLDVAYELLDDIALELNRISGR